jgi:hypothetical protein
VRAHSGRSVMCRPRARHTGFSQKSRSFLPNRLRPFALPHPDSLNSPPPRSLRRAHNIPRYEHPLVEHLVLPGRLGAECHFLRRRCTICIQTSTTLNTRRIMCKSRARLAMTTASNSRCPTNQYIKHGFYARRRRKDDWPSRLSISTSSQALGLIAESTTDSTMMLLTKVSS